MELQRQNIERRDFPSARKGYDPNEVDRHLRAIAEAVEQLRSAQRPAAATVSGAAAERVQSIVEAAEHSAREIEEQAQQDARRVAQETDAQRAEHLREAQATAEQLIARAGEVQRQVDQILAQLQQAAQQVTAGLEDGAAAVRADLEAMRNELGSTHMAPAGVPAPAPIETPEPTLEHEAAEIAQIPEEPADEPGPPDAEPEVDGTQPTPAEPRAGAAPSSEGARLIALNMALSGTPREETARYLEENFDLADQDELLDDVYARAGG